MEIIKSLLFNAMLWNRKVLALQPERYGLTDPKKVYNLAGKGKDAAG